MSFLFKAIGEAFTYGIARMRGWRIELEDAHTVRIPVASSRPFNEWAYFAVFDGHSGDKSANYARDYLLEAMLTTPEFREIAQAPPTGDFGGDEAMVQQYHFVTFPRFSTHVNARAFFAI